jgi:hypothetical protein
MLLSLCVTLLAGLALGRIRYRIWRTRTRMQGRNKLEMVVRPGAELGMEFSLIQPVRRSTLGVPGCNRAALAAL